MLREGGGDVRILRLLDLLGLLLGAHGFRLFPLTRSMRFRKKKGLVKVDAKELRCGEG